MCIEPRHGPLYDIAAMRRIRKTVAFMRIDNELGRYTECDECMPEFVRLRRRAFAVAIADDDERGRLDILDKSNGSAFGVDGGIVVDRIAEIKRHPLVDLVFAVIAEPVSETRADDRRFEAMGLRDSPHGHVAAVAPAGDAETIGINGERGEGGVNAGHYVAKVAAAEILHVGARERFAAAITAARIRQQQEISGRGQGCCVGSAAGPAWHACRRGTAVNFDDQRVFRGWIVIQRIDEPTLDFLICAHVGLPVEGFGFAPGGTQRAIHMRDLLPVADGPGPDFWRLAERLAHGSGSLSVARKRNADAESV